jgi:hypothetical protein
LSYQIELIDVEEKDRLFEKYTPRLLYTSKAEIYGCCIKLLTESQLTREKWEDNFYNMSENTRSHRRATANPVGNQGSHWLKKGRFHIKVIKEKSKLEHG